MYVLPDAHTYAQHFCPMDMGPLCSFLRLATTAHAHNGVHLQHTLTSETTSVHTKYLNT